MSGVPALSENMNTWFTQTWYEMQAEAADNITDARPVTALLKEKGCYKSRVGGDTHTRTILYGEKTAFSFKKGQTLPVTEEELKTQARWGWAYIAVPITRSFQDDQQNAGADKIADYMEERFTAAREALAKKFESVYMAEAIHDGGTDPNSLFDYVPDLATTNYFDSTPYTWGGLDRDNAWWQHADFTDDMSGSPSGNRHDDLDGPASLTMLSDMNKAYNTCGRQISFPNTIITTQDLYEVYWDICESKNQLIKDENSRLVDLGYEVLKFRGKSFVYSEDMTALQMLMINSDYLDIMYDPSAWFYMTSWERPARELEQVAYIICVLQLLGYNPRFNARLKWGAL